MSKEIIKRAADKIRIKFLKRIKRSILYIKSLKHNCSVGKCIKTIKLDVPINGVSPNYILIVYDPKIVNDGGDYIMVDVEPFEEFKSIGQAFLIRVNRVYLGLPDNLQSSLVMHEIGHIMDYYKNPKINYLNPDERMELIKSGKVAEAELNADLLAFFVIGPDYVDSLWSIGNMSMYKHSLTDYITTADYECMLRLEHLNKYIEEKFDSFKTDESFSKWDNRFDIEDWIDKFKIEDGA